MSFVVVIQFMQHEFRSAPMPASEAVKLGAQFKQANPASHVRVRVANKRSTP